MVGVQALVTAFLEFRHSWVAANTREASLLRALLREFLWSAGTAKKITSIISPAIARTIKTSIIVNPVDFLCVISSILLNQPRGFLIALGWF